jgi:hypothetical protein
MKMKVMRRIILDKSIKDFFNVEVERDALYKAPACFRHDGQRWDYIIKSTKEHAADFARKLTLTGAFKTKKLEQEGMWVVKIIKH